MEALVWMTGRVGGDVDVRESASAWSTFRLACTPRVVRGGEWGDEQTTWVTVSCSHRLAEHVRLSLRKGDPVIVVGKLRTRRWFDANGVEHEQLQIRASSVGHDLAVGTSSFYRPRRDGAPEAAAGDLAGSPQSAPGGPQDEDEAAAEYEEADDFTAVGGPGGRLPGADEADGPAEPRAHGPAEPGEPGAGEPEEPGEPGAADPGEDSATQPEGARWQVQPATAEQQPARRRGRGRAA